MKTVLNIDSRTLSHELRTPLTGISGMAEILQEEPLTPEQQSYVDAIRQSCDRLRRLIDYLLVESKNGEKPRVH